MLAVRLLVSVPQPVTYGLLLVEELLLATLLTVALLEDAALLLVLLEELELDEELELLLEEDAVTAGPTEHQAESVNALPPVNSESEQVKLPVSVAYTKVPAFPSATLWVPLIVQTEPTCAHFV